MNVLVGCTETLNPVVQRLCQSLTEHRDVERARRDLDAFWEGDSTVDVLHLHWPRALFERWRDPTRDDLSALEDRLNDWRQRVPIAVTVHNIQSHYREETPIFEALYRLVYRAADGVVHMGKTSKDRLHETYDLEGTEEVVIPHGQYDTLPNTVGRMQVRKELGIAEDTSLALVFGQVRDPEELALILDGTDAWGEGQTLVAGRLGWVEGKIVPYVVQGYHRLRTLGRPVRFRFGRFDDDCVQYFLNAADVVLIPRKHVLNSGNVALGFTFGRVVVGPDVGVVGEVLRETGNPVFDPASTRSVGTALSRGCELQAAGKGDENAAYAAEHMNWTTIADQHVQFYHSLDKSPSA